MMSLLLLSGAICTGFQNPAPSYKPPAVLKAVKEAIPYTKEGEWIILQTRFTTDLRREVTVYPHRPSAALKAGSKLAADWTVTASAGGDAIVNRGGRKRVDNPRASALYAVIEYIYTWRERSIGVAPCMLSFYASGDKTRVNLKSLPLVPDSGSSYMVSKDFKTVTLLGRNGKEER